MIDKYNTLQPVYWQNGQLHLLDQRKLPQQQTVIKLEKADEVAEAIKEMVVRGAPAIGITAAYAVVLAAKAAYTISPNHWQTIIESDLLQLAEARPTAVNLVWALERMKAAFANITSNPVPVLLKEAKRIHQEDIDANHRLGDWGAALLPSNCRILTHCNAGALATGGYGTALGVIRSAYTAGKVRQVYADETRPWLQGARLTAWELLQDNIPVTLLADSAAAALMQQKRVDWVIVGADRITANGDIANKIGTYSLAVLARQHGIKFMVAAPTSTIDMNLTSGEQIVIEQRASDEILTIGGQSIAPSGAKAWNPSFDVTPAALVNVIVTEKGVVEQPTTESLVALMG
ncbi:MAG: S-methyl-5-thioribose-1-phosphate isomerase [Gammaproteobacteria bacterium]|nr:MAG: S-methyl-5-thioribose-1-phosphate isomerase [Gammaproteobacteria bacterium]RKZ44527.1 MAG: S-methyl-5-thioribose-1-phosphate isomerase [Gammaproteobacteria bacterium]RKZ75895.1 MAG: S-methyl-5-thioribose-1-phosphate isomerase [Gammaproteobacteria bacterium]